MAEVLAGFVVGFALAIPVGPVGAVWLVRASGRQGFAKSIAPPGVSVAMLSIGLHFASVIALTALGLVLGMALAGIEDRRPDPGLGSPNVWYTLLVIALTAVLLIPALAVPLMRRVALASALAFAAMFGWAMPWLATLG